MDPLVPLDSPIPLVPVISPGNVAAYVKLFQAVVPSPILYLPVVVSSPHSPADKTILPAAHSPVDPRRT